VIAASIASSFSLEDAKKRSLANLNFSSYDNSILSLRRTTNQILLKDKQDQDN
jgi:hypothetical protein